MEQEFASGTWDGFAQEKTTRGREELRQCWVLTDVDEIRKGVRDYALWKDLTSVIVVVSERGEKGKSQTETRFYISSRVASAVRRVGAESLGH
ncbi:hypothetical protein [Fimbriiglobus ruber]|uniref:Mobile element protein n=1 Tax=Fimbriiglobus ruber TaxID=1908690 RepID=A0A225DGW9_9BACT|nr:hypothetical protein [Fimbriiglobus ruber]OWK40203.1 Mobile element protein [Fimbriiglobus ruber]